MLPEYPLVGDVAGFGGVVEGYDALFGRVREVLGFLVSGPADGIGDCEVLAHGGSGEVGVEAEEST